MQSNGEKYLENIFCDFRPLKKIDYQKKKNIISCVLFKMKLGGYKNFNKYLEGVKSVAEIAKFLNFEVRLFIDYHIYIDKKIMDYLQTFSIVTLILFSCSDFLIDNYHVSVFGTLVRFFPLFNFPNNDASLVIISDIDYHLHSKLGKNYASDYLNMDPKYFNIPLIREVYLWDLVQKKDVGKSVKFGYIGRYSNIFVKREIYRPICHHHRKIFLPYCIAYKMISDGSLPSVYLVKFLKKLKIYMNSQKRSAKILSTYEITAENQEKKCEKRICYGVDEYFINAYLLRKFVRDDIPFWYSYTYSISQYYYFVHPKITNFAEINMPEREYTQIFNHYLEEVGLDKIPFEKIDKMIYIKKQEATQKERQERVDNNIRKFGKRMIKLLDKIYRQGDFRIYGEQLMDLYHSVDHKKYFSVSGIHFINYDHPDIIFDKVLYQNRDKEGKS